MTHVCSICRKTSKHGTASSTTVVRCHASNSYGGGCRGTRTEEPVMQRRTKLCTHCFVFTFKIEIENYKVLYSIIAEICSSGLAAVHALCILAQGLIFPLCSGPSGTPKAGRMCGGGSSAPVKSCRFGVISCANRVQAVGKVRRLCLRITTTTDHPIEICPLPQTAAIAERFLVRFQRGRFPVESPPPFQNSSIRAIANIKSSNG